MRLPEVKPTIIDRIVGYFSPVSGIKRQHARMRMAISGGFTGARRGRRQTSQWDTSAGEADDDLLPDLPVLRERSRDLIRNNPIAGGAIHTKVTNVVGTGLRLQSHVDRDVLGLSEESATRLNRQIEREWKLFSESAECDLGRTSAFPDLQDLAFRQVLENGDVFALLPMRQRRGSPYSLKIQLVEADRVSNADRKSDSKTLRAGVEMNVEGAPIAYHIADSHPGAYGFYSKGTKWERKLAFGRDSGRRNVLHLYRKLRVGQTRGMPDLAPVIEPLKQLDRYTEAELMAAVVAGLFTVFIKTEGPGLDAPMQPTSETGGKSSDKDYKLAAGSMWELLPGEDITTADPGRPNESFDPFVQAILRQIGVALELPFELLIKHFTSSYTAARASFIEAWKFFRGRRQWLVRCFCRPIYEEWFEEAVLRGRISAPGFVNGDASVRAAYLSSEWIGDAPGQINEAVEVKAAADRVDAGFSTKKRETAHLTGQDWDEVNEQRRREKQAEVQDE